VATKPQIEFEDEFSIMDGGMESGVEVIALKKNQFAYGTNTTCRGLYLTNRPAYRQIKLIPDTGVSFGASRFQGACYYKPDIGSESLIAQIGGRLYQFLPDTVGNAGVFDRTVNGLAPGSTLPSVLDPNPANVTQAWLWQSENYVIVEDGQSRPIIFDGAFSRRSVTPSFIGTVAGYFTVPAINQPVSIALNAPFLDAVGTYIQLSPLNLFPFLMQVQSINGNVITVRNTTGLSAVGDVVPVGTPIVSANAPAYAGTVSVSIPAPGIPAIGASFQITVTPDFTGKVGDNIILTDGTGALTAYTLNVTAIAGGGSGILTVKNVNAPFGNPTANQGVILNAGYPVISENVIPSELPIGRMGAYVQGRNWISSPDGKSFIASDLVGSSSGTQQFNFRDAVLNWSQNTTRFTIPGGAGEINCIIALGALDASLGQGPLQILCDNQIFTCSAPTDATTWANLSTPILPVSIIGFGGVGQNAAVVSNGDLILKSGDASIHSLKLARQDFNQWGNLPISAEVNRVINHENFNELSRITFGIADNRALLSCVPIDSAGGVYSQGLIALDFDESSSLQGKLPSVYDGVWMGLNSLQIVTGKFNKVDRTFVFQLNTTTNQVELWEILTDGEEIVDTSYDVSGNPITTPITWSFESPMIFNNVKGKNQFDLIQWKEADIYFSEIVGQLQVVIYYRPDFSECWHKLHSFTVKNNRPRPSYLMKGAMPEPSNSELSDALKSTPAPVARFYQVRVEITGSCIFQGMTFKSVLIPESIPGQVICD
jgi:hypothetical protein